MCAEEAIVVRDGEEVAQLAVNDEIFLRIAEDIDWLLTHRMSDLNREGLRRYYMRALSERHLCSLK